MSILGIRIPHLWGPQFYTNLRSSGVGVERRGLAISSPSTKYTFKIVFLEYNVDKLPADF